MSPCYAHSCSQVKEFDSILRSVAYWGAMDESAKTSRDLRNSAKRRLAAEREFAIWKALIRKRKEQGATLREIADEAGVSHQAIAYILKEEST